MHIKDFVKGEAAERLYRVTGDDPYYLKCADRYFENLIGEDAKAFDFKSFSIYPGAEVLLNEAERIPMFSKRNVIVVTDRETPFKKEDDALTKLLESVPEEAVIVFSGAKYLSAKQQAMCAEISAARLSAAESLDAMAAFFPAGIERRAAYALQEYCNRDMNRIYNESVKLNAYSGGKEVKLADVEALVPKETEHAVFEFYDLLKKKDRRGAYRVMDRLKKKGEQPQYLLSSLTGQYRRMLYGAISPNSDRELAKVLNVKEFAVKKAREAARASKPVVLKQQFDRLTQLEYRARSGELSAETALKLAVEALLEG